MKVFLNPGHDRKLDSGAINRTLKLRECDWAYDLGTRVKRYLEKQQVTVEMEQQDNLYEVCEHANKSGADLFVSLHFNAFNTRASGTEVFVSNTPASVLLGHIILSHIHAVLPLPNRGIKERMELFVLRQTIMPAVLVEPCFIDNNTDVRMYTGKEDACAKAIATGIMQYPTLTNHAQKG
ncbi:N-acetylmuramoyl-L-alanine amidase [Veillonellaceae bacterium M2-8]|uniref:N-acetylmuramoyl-L-alanine amidase family protein n=1 Tax=uncultured Megasphaera sp. TaxID=165188 RepID=UPI0012E100B5|nr:N-acetylmuramoyl-L-alanine amidase [uncultured Megasphaera sp.]MUP47972.1 N-acetylmuramoyl-L-alanine amidase [Veillonellaceae bacterium M2-8]